MEKPLFPSKYIRITQGYNEGTHKSSYAIDNADKDSGISNIYAPFTGIIKKIYTNDANEVWLESAEKVEYPDGTIDYMTVMFAHANDVSNLFVGKRITRGESFYKEGTKGNVTGNHCHIECGRGKFTGTGWHKNSSGYWSINNAKKPEECFWIDDSIKVLSSKYSFKKISVPKEIVKEVKSEEKKEEKIIDQKNTNTISTSNKIFIAPKADLYGIYLRENQKIIIEN